MSETKKYYWLKLKRDFFKRHDTKIVESMENGKDYLLFYMKLLVESIDHEGSLRFSENIPYDAKMLTTITDTNIDIVRSAVKVFTELGMMSQLDDGTLYMEQVAEMIGSETSDSIRMKLARDKKKQELESSKGEHCSKSFENRSPELELELELEIDKEIDKDTNTSPTSVAATVPTKKTKVKETEPQVLDLSKSYQAAFESDPIVKAEMWKQGMQGRTGKALQTIAAWTISLALVKNVHYETLAAQVMESYRIVCKKRTACGFSPIGLATAWVWELVIKGLKADSRQTYETTQKMLDELKGGE